MNLQTIENLKYAIAKQLEVLQKIFSIEKEKHTILLSGKLRDFSAINQKLLDELANLESCELSRQQVMDSFIKENISFFEHESDLTFVHVLESIKDTYYYGPMLQLFNQSKEVVKQIKHYTNINKDLIESALNVLNITLQQDNKEIDYTKKTELRTSSILLNRVI